MSRTSTATMLVPKRIPGVAEWAARCLPGVAYLQLTPDSIAPKVNLQHEPNQLLQVSLDLPTDMSRRLRAFAEIRALSLHIVLLAGYVAMLHRFTEQDDLLLGYSDEATEVMLPLRATIHEDTTFAHLLKAVTQWTRDAAEAPDVLLEGFATGHAGKGETGFAPVVFLGLHDTCTPHAGAACPTLALAVEDPSFSLRLTLHAMADLYRRDTAERLLQAMAHLLESAMDSPATPVAELRLLSPAEASARLLSYAGPNLDTGPFEAAHHVIERWSILEPSRIAVECNGRSLSYAELLDRASAIAECILAEGIASRSRIALCMDRSADMPAALLAVLLCGCTYVPLDPLFPRERMEAALGDAEAALLLTDGTGDLPPGTPQLALRDIPQRPIAALPHIEVTASDIAYIIYTSGSTGKPKGVAISHGALRSLLCVQQQTPGFTADDIQVAITTLTFDISVADIWLPLFTGARLVVATQEQSHNPALLESLLNRSKATALQATPGFWRAMVEHGWTTHAPGAASVRVLCGGESMSRDLADLLLERAPEVWNMYGPTECTVWVSATRVLSADTAPTIDTVMPNSQFYVLDRALQAVPLGITGELVIGGDNVGAGYWNRPELTAEKFVPNPFGSGMLYRTGDLAQLRPEGGLRLLGRADFQVKVRGFRIELGEIEHVLAQHPAVREAVVVQQTLPATPGAPASMPLVAFVDVGSGLAKEAYPALVRELEADLRRSLPEYMVPAGILPLPELPRLFNSKVNRKALPLFIAMAAPAASSTYVAPRDFLERQLAQIWQTTLGIDRISTDASYFSLGGDSLTALRLINRVNRTFAMQLGLANLLTSNSIAALADLVRDHHKPSVRRALVPLRTTGSLPPLFLLHGVGGNILNFIGLAGRLDANQPVYALQAQALLTGQAALLRLQDMAAFYIQEMQTVQPHGPYRLLGYSFGGTLAIEIARQLRSRGEQIALLAMLDARTRAFEEAHRDLLGKQGAFKSDFARFVGNTSTLSRKERARYIVAKLATRSVRYAALAFNKLRIRKLPSFLKVAWDVNLMAFRQYRPQVNTGKLVLFRAKHQDFAEGAKDLGWSRLFPEGVIVHEIDSDHERIFLEPALQVLAQQLTEVLRHIAVEEGSPCTP